MTKDTLRGTLGIRAIVFMVIAPAAPLTVMVATLPLIISIRNGAAAPFNETYIGYALSEFLRTLRQSNPMPHCAPDPGA